MRHAYDGQTGLEAGSASDLVDLFEHHIAFDPSRVVLLLGFYKRYGLR